MPLSALEKYNEQASEPLKNARNAAAGAKEFESKDYSRKELVATFL